MIPKLILTILFFNFFLISCSDSNCKTCRHENFPNDETEFCENDGITFTDNDGNVISFEELIELRESMGFECQ